MGFAQLVLRRALRHRVHLNRSLTVAALIRRFNPKNTLRWNIGRGNR
jgi:hypothetical protein